MAAIRRNGYYADPALGTAFDNLAAAFATPSGADVAGFANASATREKALRLQDLFNNPNDPDFDRKNIVVGNLNGTNTIAAQNQNDATTRRNADVSARATTDVANINNAGAIARQFAQPIIAGDGQTVMLPTQTAAATGLPTMFRGNITTGQGQTVTTPGGEVIAGPAKPPTDAEIKGVILGRQTPQDQRAVVMQGVGVSPVVGKDGEPVNVFTPDAAGKTPYKPDDRNRQLGTFVLPDGKTKGEAFFDNDTNRWKSSQDGVDLPQGSQIVRTPPTQVNIDTKAPSAIETAYGEGVGAQLKTTVEAGIAAPRNIAEIAQFRDALSRAGDNITTGPLSSYVLKGKQAIGGMLGTDLSGVPEAELINNIGFKLATAAVKAISSRPTQYEFAQALNVKPGLALSKPGMMATLSIMEQNGRDDQALATLANDPANRQNWNATVQKYYAEHPVMSPFDPSKPLGRSDIEELERRAGPAAMAPASVPGVASAPPAGPSAAAVTALKQDPSRAADFDAKFGAGASARALGVR